MDDTQTILSARLDKTQVVEVYEKVAPIYDLWAHLTERRARERCLELAAVRDGESVLEVAVGTGTTFQRLLTANPSGRTEGIDLTAGMLRRAETKARQTGVGGYRLAIGDAYRLEFADETFDLVVNSYMFDLLPEADFASVLGEMTRVLRPGGRLCLVNMTKGERWTQRLAETVYRVRPQWLGGCRGVRMEPHVRAAGLVVTHRELVAQLTFPSEVILARKAPAPRG